MLIDVQNMYHSAKNLYSSKVNFKEILKTAIAGRKLVRAIAYVIRSESEEERAFFDALSKQGFEVKSKDLQVYFGGAKKADWDVGIAIDAVKTAEIVDVVVLASGDGDYAPLVEYLKNRGRRVEIIAFGKSTSSKLREIADSFVDLDENPKKFLLKGEE